MQLKLKRSQRAGGIMGGKVLFGLDARAELTPDEQSLVRKYSLGKIVVYDSEARKALFLRASLSYTTIFPRLYLRTSDCSSGVSSARASSPKSTLPPMIPPARCERLSFNCIGSPPKKLGG